jgi:hypothetical protein
MPTKLNLEDKTGIDKGIKEEDRVSIPLKSRFLVAFLRIALIIISSSVAVEPSSATACLALRLAPQAATAGGRQNLSTATAGTSTGRGEARDDVDEAAPIEGTSTEGVAGAEEWATGVTCMLGPAEDESRPAIEGATTASGTTGPTTADGKLGVEWPRPASGGGGLGLAAKPKDGGAEAGLVRGANSEDARDPVVEGMGGLAREEGSCNNSEIVIHFLLNKIPNFGPR